MGRSLAGYFPGRLPAPRGPEAFYSAPPAVRGCTRQRAAPARTLAGWASASEPRARLENRGKSWVFGPLGRSLGFAERVGTSSTKRKPSGNVPPPYILDIVPGRNLAARETVKAFCGSQSRGRARKPWKILGFRAVGPILGRLLFRTAPRAPRAGGFLFGTPSGATLHSSAGGPCAHASRLGVSVGVLGSDPRCSENLEIRSKSAPAAEMLAAQRSYCFIAYSTFKRSAERFKVLCVAGGAIR